MLMSKSTIPIGDNPPIHTVAMSGYEDIVDSIAAATEVDSLRDITHVPSAHTPDTSYRRVLIEHPIYPYLDIKHPMTNDVPHILTKGRLYLMRNFSIHEFYGLNSGSLLF